MLENETTEEAAQAATDTTDTGAQAEEPKRARAPRRRAASRPAGPPPEIDDTPPPAPPSVAVPAAAEALAVTPQAEPPAVQGPAAEPPAAQAPADGEPEPPVRKPVRATRTRKRAVAPEPVIEEVIIEEAAEEEIEEEPEPVAGGLHGGIPAITFQPPMVVFQPPARVTVPASVPMPVVEAPAAETDEEAADEDEDESSDRPSSRRRRRRGGRGRGKISTGEDGDEDEEAEPAAEAEPVARTARTRRRTAAKEQPEEPAAEDVDDHDEDEEGPGGSTRRRRRRRRRGGAGDSEETHDDPPNTVVHLRSARAEARAAEDEVQSVRGSTRLEAKKQRRREGREQGRRRPPIVTESEFLARRESVERVMVIREDGERIQIAVLEDDILVEHHVDRASHQSYVGNVYLGKVQNVLPSMEAAFIDVGKGRNAVLYAGEVNWDIAGLEGHPRRIESALKSGQPVLVQVTKDPLGHKGARLTSQISLPGRYLVYVPDGSMTGISRKLPDKERTRLKQILRKIMPENAGVIVRTAAEGASEEELAHDVTRLAAQWENIQKQAKTASAPALLHGEPDMTVRVVRDIFNEDFTRLVVDGDDSWDTVEEYVGYVAPHMAERVSQWTADEDVFTAYRVEEQLAKALERKVWLPSGGSLVIDRTEAMTVIDVNTGKFTGQGGNLEETVTRNNLEAAEEIVRQLRLRDVGGIIVIDFIDMVLESNRDLVLRRLLECLSRDRTKHQVAEVTSLGLVQMTRKRVGQGLLEAFSEPCECCNGRGIHVSLTTAEAKQDQGEAPGKRRKRKGAVERAVENKIAQHEATKIVEDEPEFEPELEEAVVEEAEEAPVTGTVRRRRAPRRTRAKAEEAPAES